MRDSYVNDCLVILSHLNKSGYSSLQKLSQSTGVSITECRRYLLPKTEENRPNLYEKAKEWRKKSPKLYKQAIENGVMSKGCGKLNTSKHVFLRHVADKFGYSLVPCEEYPGYDVVKLAPGYTKRAHHNDWKHKPLEAIV